MQNGIKINDYVYVSETKPTGWFHPSIGGRSYTGKKQEKNDSK